MKNTSKIGEISLAQVLAALVRSGKSVLVPFGDSKRYDFVIEDESGQFFRVQCKTGKVQNGVVWFPTCSIHARSRTGQKTARRSYAGQVDFFGVFCPSNGRVYLIPLTDLAKHAAFLRIEATKNNQKKRIRWAKDYELASTSNSGDCM